MKLSHRSGRSVHPPTDVADARTVSLLVYQRAVKATDHLPPNDLVSPILGLFGEVGSLLAILKKKTREATAYTAFQTRILEELGDVLWYITCTASHAQLDISVLCQRSYNGPHDQIMTARSQLATWADVQCAHRTDDRQDLLTCIAFLAELSGTLVGHLRAGRLGRDREILSEHLVRILKALISTATAAHIDMDRAARRNLEKIFSRYPLDETYPTLADAEAPRGERLPRRFEILIEELEAMGKTYVVLTCNGVIVGDRLTDNKTAEDDYRFHDVFHIAYAVHLGWSPILRGLFRVKRKSVPALDENEDGARAGLIEEGISTFIFGRALERNLFEGLDSLDFDLLKLVQEFARGFEVERCALWQWERAILDGFKVFRELKLHRRGYVTADLESHTIEFRPLVHQADELPRQGASAAVPFPD